MNGVASKSGGSQKLPSWTVVLLRSTDPDDSYVAIGVRATTAHAAVDVAKREAIVADRADHGSMRRTGGAYAVVVVFPGSHKPALFGWQY